MGLTLPAEGSVYLDANGFIYSVERIEPYRTVLDPLWKGAQAGKFEIVTSELTLLETLVKPLRDDDALLQELFRTLLNAREVRLIPATAALWERAAALRARIPRLRTPDALHAATALVVGTPMFLTNDPGFRQIAGLPVTLLSEVPEDSE
jgi:predicted nucleic acid-binding protein